MSKILKLLVLIDDFLKVLSDFEVGELFRFHFNLIAGARVSPDIRAVVFHRERTQPPDLDSVARFQSVSDVVEENINSLVRDFIILLVIFWVVRELFLAYGFN